MLSMLPALLGLFVLWIGVNAEVDLHYHARTLSEESTAPFDSVVVFAKGEGGYYCHKIPYLFRTFSGVLLAFAEGRGLYGRSACDDFSGTDLVMKTSYDGGESWSNLRVVFSNSTEDSPNIVGNAAPVQDLDTSRIWLPFCRNNEEVFITFSDDDGATWSDPVFHPNLVHHDWKWVGLGPPGGIQLHNSEKWAGRMLIPAYHTTLVKGDGLLSAGHTIYSDDSGLSWQIGSANFGGKYLANECQAVELRNGSVLINARTVSNNRVQVISNDGGITFEHPYIVPGLVQPLEGCEGSLFSGEVLSASSSSSSSSTGNEKNSRQGGVSLEPVHGLNPEVRALYFSDPYTHTAVRKNMTIFRSVDEGATWSVYRTVDEGSVAYSSLQWNGDIRRSNEGIISTWKDDAEKEDDDDADGVVGGYIGQLEILYERSYNESLVFEPDEIVYWRVL